MRASNNKKEYPYLFVEGISESKRNSILRSIRKFGYVFTTLEQYNKDMKRNKQTNVKYPELLDLPRLKREAIARHIRKGYVYTTIEQYDKDIEYKCKNKFSMRKKDYGGLVNMTKKQRYEFDYTHMTDSYICSCLHRPQSAVNKETIETTRILLMLKRELQIGGTKLRKGNV